jgi:hypothetical protein
MGPVSACAPVGGISGGRAPTHVLTVALADKPGLGFFVDHLAKIDGNHDGTLEFSEVKGFRNAVTDCGASIEGDEIIE